MTINQIGKGRLTGNVTNPALWVDNIGKRLYSWGGDPKTPQSKGDNDDPEMVDLKVFEPDGQGSGVWSTQEPKNRQIMDFLRIEGGGYASCDGSGYYLGGYATIPTSGDGSEEREGPEVLSFNMEEKEWSERYLISSASPNGDMKEGEAVCGSVADADPHIFTFGGRAGDSAYRPMDNINFYSPKDKKWYSQATTGDTPPRMDLFCAVGVQSPGGTYDIYHQPLLLPCLYQGTLGKGSV